MDKQLQECGLGLSVNSFYCCFLHADDIRTVATSNGSLERQVAIVKEFTVSKAKCSQCEVDVWCGK